MRTVRASTSLPGPFAEGALHFIAHLRVEKGASQNTVDAYRNDLSFAAQCFAEQGARDWSELTPDHFIQFEISLTPAARSTARRRISALRSLLKFLRHGGEGPKDLPSRAGIKLGRPLPKALTIEQVEAVMRGANLQEPEGSRDRALMELLYGSGLRITEAVELDRGEVDLRDGALRVTGKGNKVRHVPIPAGTAEWLRIYIKDVRPRLASAFAPTLIVSNHGGPLARSQAYDLVARYGRLAGLDQKIGPHTFRHTYAVHLLQGGANIREIQELLGHETIATTHIYTELDLQEVKARYHIAHPRA